MHLLMRQQKTAKNYNNKNNALNEKVNGHKKETKIMENNIQLIDVGKKQIKKYKA